MTFEISRRLSVFKLPWTSHVEALSWQDLTTLFSEPRLSSCTRQTCPRGSCPDKSGACWSPATWRAPSLGVAKISLLVFDVEQHTDDQIDEIRGRLSDLQYLMHSTHSDLPGSRCLRIIIELSRPVEPEAWKLFFHTALQDFAPNADPACADPGRFYFLPSCPRNAPYFLQINRGRPLDVDARLAIVPAPSVLTP